MLYNIDTVITDDSYNELLDFKKDVLNGDIESTGALDSLVDKLICTYEKYQPVSTYLILVSSEQIHALRNFVNGSKNNEEVPDYFKTFLLDFKRYIDEWNLKDE